MEKAININGMTCNHCGDAVKKALEAVAGVKAKVNVKKGVAIVKLSEDIDDRELNNAVVDAGYEVVSIKEDRK